MSTSIRAIAAGSAALEARLVNLKWSIFVQNNPGNFLAVDLCRKRSASDSMADYDRDIMDLKSGGKSNGIHNLRYYGLHELFFRHVKQEIPRMGAGNRKLLFLRSSQGTSESPFQPSASDYCTSTTTATEMLAWLLLRR